MRILHTEASCGWGGQEIRILSEAQGLIERGHEVHLACVPNAPIHREAARFGVPVTGLPIGKKRLAGLWAMYHFLRAGHFDVVNTHSSTDSWLVALACQCLSGPPAIVRTRHISAPINSKRSTRWLYAKATSHIVTTGEALREQLLSTLPIDPVRIVSIPTGVDTHRFCPVTPELRQLRRRALGLPEDLPIVGIVATLRSWKGHRYLVEAFAQGLVGRARLVIVGDGPQQAALKAQIHDLNLERSVMLVGGQNDVVPWLQSFDIFVLPSYANEGVPQALMQAMACGLPAVTTAVGAIPELARNGETAWVVPHENVQALAAGLNRLLEDEPLRLVLGQAARNLVTEHHGRVCMLDRMEALFAMAAGEAVGVTV